MRVSAKGRYALAAMLYMARKYSAETPITVLNLAENLGVSKIYLEQVFSLLKRSGLVISVKGAHGGYQLAAPPSQINAFQILAATDFALVEKTENTVNEKDPAIEEALRRCVFSAIDQSFERALAGITLAAMAEEAAACEKSNEWMYFI